MPRKPQKELALKEKVKSLEEEILRLKKRMFDFGGTNTVKVPDQIKPLFDNAQKVVGEYFKSLQLDPSHGTITIGDQRYVLVRAAALSIDFIDTIKKLYDDKGEREANLIGNNFLFDISHVIGINDAITFHQKMKVEDPIAKLSAGPIHFAYSGWAYVEILPQSNPTPDENYFLIYHHPYSFEADSWIKAGKKADFPVCIMNSGYSSGWCEASFGIPLTAVEISCKAKGDEHCTFIMAPPDKIHDHIKKYTAIKGPSPSKHYDIPTFFERKKVEEGLHLARMKAEESAKSKMTFLANMSHEIRTPLNAILGYVDLILTEKPNKDHTEYLETIKDSGNLLHSIVNDILDLSKIEAGQLILHPVPCLISEVLRQCELSALSLIHNYSKSIKLNKQLPEVTGIYADPVRLQQVLNNLLSNAVKFTEEGVIDFGVKKIENGRMHFFIKDPGIGIPVESINKIFGAFSQVDNTFTRNYGGSGLGLKISKKLVEMMGGEMWFESSCHQGSTFYFTLPYDNAVHDNIKKITAVPVEKLSEKKLILLVEDNLINQNLTKIILQKSGYNVITANNGKVAIETYVSNRDIDAIVMDVQMPFMDGLTATKSIREYEKVQKISPVPVIALTAHALKGDMENCLQAGCNRYLTKPIVVSELIREIDILTGSSRPASIIN